MKRFVPFLIALTAGCSEDATTSPPAADAEEVTVFAASSLTGAFEEIATGFETANPGTGVLFNFGPSDGLAAQIQSEGVADVFASASQSWMDEVEDDPGVEGRIDFVTNRLVLVTPPDNPAAIESLEDLTTPGVQLVLAAEGVPVGDYSREMLANAGIANEALANVVSNEADNASVVAKVEAGEADAAIVYTSDVSEAAGTDLTAFEIPDDVNVIATYPIAVVVGGQSELGRAFVDHVLGSEGQAVLQEFGFGAPA
jgi:molybdate transport system substrate-binding protein